MQYLVLGLLALVLGIFLAKGYTRVPASVLSHRVPQVLGLAALLLALILLVRGSGSYALPLAVLGLWLIAGPGGWVPAMGRTRKSAGQTSRVVTDHLDIELDHDSGAIYGRVLKGLFAGRSIESLKPAELALLWQDCRFTDARSAQIVEAYLDRTHATWREDVARGEAEMASGPDGRMSREEALAILGLEEGASEEEVRRAHRDLMQRLHPDKGGSNYLASKINEAKAVLLGPS